MKHFALAKVSFSVLQSYFPFILDDTGSLEKVDIVLGELQRLTSPVT